MFGSSNNEDSVPVLAYIMVGITSFVLAYATFLDTEELKDETVESNTSLLPAVPNLNPFSQATPVSEPSPVIAAESSTSVMMPSMPSLTSLTTPIQNAIPIATPKVGGKTKGKNLKNKKHTRNKRLTKVSNLNCIM